MVWVHLKNYPAMFRGREELFREVHRALREAGISVVMISQGSSEHSICFAVPEAHGERARGIVRQAFALELEQGQIQGVDVQPGCSILAIVGDGDFLSNAYLGNAGNLELGLRLLRWLSREDRMLKIPPRLTSLEYCSMNSSLSMLASR